MLKKPFIVLMLLAFSSISFAQKADKNRHLISISDKNWSLEVSLPEFSVTETGVFDPRRLAYENGRIDAEIKSEGCELTIIWAKTSEKRTSTELRDLASNTLKQIPIEKDDYQLSEYKGFPILEYLIKEFRGIELNQKLYSAYIAKDGVRIEIHFSKTSFKTGDEKRFFALLDSVKYIENKPAVTAETK